MQEMDGECHVQRQRDQWRGHLEEKESRRQAEERRQRSLGDVDCHEETGEAQALEQ